MISNANNQLIIPTKTSDPDKIRLLVPGQDKYGKELLLKADEPLEFRRNEELRVWHSEDFYNVVEVDNSGTQCIHVYAEFC